MPLLEGGMTTRRSGLRLFMPRLLPPGGGGDFVGITLLRPFPPAELPSKPGDAREFTNPFPKKKETGNYLGGGNNTQRQWAHLNRTTSGNFSKDMNLC